MYWFPLFAQDFCQCHSSNCQNNSFRSYFCKLWFVKVPGKAADKRDIIERKNKGKEARVKRKKTGV